MGDERFERLFRAAARTRAISPQLRALLAAIYDGMQQRPVDRAALKASLEALLSFLASEGGRTDANCCTVDFFFSSEELAGDLAAVPPEFRAVFDDMGGTLHDAVYAAPIAANFESLPEQLLARVRKI